jgi:DNA-binding response OmpR family regulator
VGTIVVASDAPSVRADVAAALGEPDTELIEVNTGFDVAPAVDEHEPDLVVVDMQMGNMGAMAVCMNLRLEASWGNLPEVPVLMLLDRRADVFLARRAGAEGWVVKPLDPLRLRRAARALQEGGTYHDESLLPVPSFIAPDTPAGTALDAGINTGTGAGASPGGA